jgi:hypothetical protein
MREGGRLRWLAWVAAAVPWAALVAFMTFGSDADSGAERFRRFLGAVLVTLFPALLFRWIYTKAGGERVWSPWLFAIATLAALVAARGVEWTADAERDGRHPPEVDLGALMGDPPPGYRYARTPPAERRQVRRLMAHMEGATGYQVRDVVGGGHLHAVVWAMSMDVDEPLDTEGEADFREGVEEMTGTRLRSTVLGGEEILTTAVPGQGRLMVRLERDAVVALIVLNQAQARPLARAILAE